MVHIRKREEIVGYIYMSYFEDMANHSRAGEVARPKT